LFALFTVIGLVFLIAGGAGLIITHTMLSFGGAEWILANITFGTFSILAVIILFVLTIYPSEMK